ncbi:prion-like-(Q/N-rich) domain-bearing protein 25 [Pomacea canaliculata]|uniref:prion-like-(Q/N-rich) domain-bearing protein 25 n=1 Tax=Pomacea canaliculata TaxID=400727 RepID=UPI000D73345D|nr:prion-like-(Q/N-rich) domain-bearing protein 25 [Pomacea canaliculata]
MAIRMFSEEASKRVYGCDAAAGDTGDVCSSSACSDTTNAVCDKVYEKCLIKAGKACAGANANNCIFGASCQSSVCTCGNGYNKATDLCTPKVGGTAGTDCSSAATLCTTPNSECNNQVCKCKNGFIINIDDGKCDGAVGTACTAKDTCVTSTICDSAKLKCLIRHGKSCVGNTDKCVSHATCSENVCQCDASTTVASPDGVCMIRHGQSCVGNTDKCVSHATCSENVCQCDASTTVASPDGVCTLKNSARSSAIFSCWMLFVALTVGSSTVI